MDRFVHWAGSDAWRAETVEALGGPRGLHARGTQLGVEPLPYRLDYELDAPEGFVTRRLVAEARGEGWARRLVLERGSTGRWSCDTDASGDPGLADPGGPVGELGEALDCDLEFSPLTNLMPVRRSRLDVSPGAGDFLMAWVSVPDLELLASPQRYEHVRTGGPGAIVRFLDRGLFDGFTAELPLDRDGLVIDYPGLARRIVASAPASG